MKNHNPFLNHFLVHLSHSIKYLRLKWPLCYLGNSTYLYIQLNYGLLQTIDTTFLKRLRARCLMAKEMLF